MFKHTLQNDDNYCQNNTSCDSELNIFQNNWFYIVFFIMKIINRLRPISFTP